MGNYKHKTTTTQYRRFKQESKNQGQLLHKIYMNEVNKSIHYQVFLSQLATWLRNVHGVDTKTGVIKINDYLRKIFV
jgi:hypothetical protein